MTRRAPGFGVGTEISPGTVRTAREEPRPEPTRIVREGGALVELKALTGSLRALVNYRRILRHTPYDGDEDV